MNEEQYFWGRIADRLVSFNVRRTFYGYGDEALRSVVVRRVDGLRMPILIPGVDLREEKLLREIFRYQPLKQVEQVSFCLFDKICHSLLWRFALSQKTKVGKGITYELLTGQQRKEVNQLVKSHNRRLSESLQPGRVIIIPDREISFGRSRKVFQRKPYSRKVMIFSCDEHQVTFMPFTTKVSNRFCNPKFDILFDYCAKSVDMRSNARPVVTNHCAEIGKTKVLLKVACAQSMSRLEFVETALRPLGRISPELVALAGSRLAGKKPFGSLKKTT
jgi:hypothetical protein